MAFPRSKLRRRRYRFAVALVVTVLVVVVGHDITRAAHADPQSRTIQNTNFAAIANAMVTQSDALGQQLVLTLNEAPSKSRLWLGSQINALVVSAQNLEEHATALSTPVIAANEQERVRAVLLERTATIEQVAAVLSTSLALPVLTGVPASSPAAIVNLSRESDRRWLAAQSVLLGEPGHVHLVDSVFPLSNYALGTALSNVSQAANLQLQRSITISAVAVQPSPFPAAVGQLVLPPVTSFTLGVTVTNEAYVLQPYAVSVSVRPTSGGGGAFLQTFSGNLGPSASYAVLPDTITVLPGERAIVTIQVSGAGVSLNGGDQKRYQLVVSTSPAG